MFIKYNIWWQMRSGQIAMTPYAIKARTDKEAQSKTKRKMNYFGFDSSRFIAAISGQAPNV